MTDSKAMSFKARMNNFAIRHGMRPQTVIHSYMFERFLTRLAASQYRNKFILKGGFLIASKVGISLRSTLDIDTTIVDSELNMRNVKKVFEEICAIDVLDEVNFSIYDTERIHWSEAEYDGIRVKISSSYHEIRVIFSVDITSGDYVEPILYSYKCHFSEESLDVMAYPVENILAEKCHAILKHGIFGTRMKDFYDIYILTHIDKPSTQTLKNILLEVFSVRHGEELIEKHLETLQQILQDKSMKSRWEQYQITDPYAKGLKFYDVVNAISSLLEETLS